MTPPPLPPPCHSPGTIQELVWSTLCYPPTSVHVTITSSSSSQNHVTTSSSSSLPPPSSSSLTERRPAISQVERGGAVQGASVVSAGRRPDTEPPCQLPRLKPSGRDPRTSCGRHLLVGTAAHHPSPTSSIFCCCCCLCHQVGFFFSCCIENRYICLDVNIHISFVFF